MLGLKRVKGLIKEALREDIGSGDITTRAIISPQQMAEAVILAKEAGIIAGLFVAREVFQQLDPKIRFFFLVKEGAKVRAGPRIALIKGKAQAILGAERVALNFIQRISGIATETYRCVKEVSSFKTRILDTRKTLPGWRYLDKYAVRLGGGKNHRQGLYDELLIKDNHLACHKDIGEVLRKARARYPHKKIEIEVRNLQELREVIESGVLGECPIDTIMLDNMSLENIRRAIKIIKRRCRIEVSGRVPFSQLRKLACLGVDYISLGRLTHSASSLDVSLKIIKWI